MNRRIVAALTVLALLLPSLGAFAAPVMRGPGGTAWLGADNHMFLIDGEGTLKELPSAIADIIGIDGENIYCTTASGRLYAVRLDGSASSLVNAAPTEEELAAYRPATVYELHDGVLSRTGADGTPTVIAADVIAFAESDTALWFVRAESTGACTLNALPLATDAAALAPIIRLVTEVRRPVSMILTPDALTMVCEDHSVQVLDLETESLVQLPAISDRTASAAVMQGKLYRYAADGSGWRVENAELFTPQPSPTPVPVPTERTVFVITPAPATATPFIVTPAPTSRRATPRPTATPAQDDTIRKWDTGDAVRKMQRRLQALGYPVGRVDGSYGEQTDIAVRLFQSSVGLAEHTYLTKKGQNRLYAADAPVYDAFMDLKRGDRGIRVRLMQERLFVLGFNPGKIDGIYGANTVAAVAAYQRSLGMQLEPGEIPGEKASRWLLMNLYGEIDTVTAGPVITPGPTPTAAPEETAMPGPTGEPDPTPSAAPDPTPTSDPEPTPTSDPDPTPTGVPDPTSTTQPDPTPTGVPDPTPTAAADPSPSPVPDGTENSTDQP